jgi:predicted DsbA family dithiol-disulfide isomerase
LTREFAIELRWVAFPLHPEIPPEGVTLEKLFEGRGIDIPTVLSRLESAARSFGLPFGTRRMSFNSRRAQEGAKWAEAQGRADAYHLAVFKAYFVEGRNLHEVETLVRAAESAGLEGAGLVEALNSRAYKAAVDEDWMRSHRLGITAVPSFRLNQEMLVGAQPYEQLAAFATAHGVPRRAAA